MDSRRTGFTRPEGPTVNSHDRKVVDYGYTKNQPGPKGRQLFEHQSRSTVGPSDLLNHKEP